jgi:hypothetical protein
MLQSPIWLLHSVAQRDKVDSVTSQPAISTGDPRPCDHCGLPAVFRVALAASYSDEHMEELHFCVERFQEIAAEEPRRLLGVINLAASPRTMVTG